MDVFLAVITHPVVFSTLSAFCAAVVEDWRAFQRFNTYNEYKAYDWGVVRWKAIRGTVVGFVTGVGLWLTSLGLKFAVGMP